MKEVVVLMSIKDNFSDYLEKSIDSILSQSYKDFEFVIIADGSNDKTLDILGDIKRKQRFFVAGEMAELGSEENSYHQEICKYSEERVDEFLCVGELWSEGLKKVTHKSKLFSSKDKLLDTCIGFGRSQSPSVNDYADNIDTLKFLQSI